MESFIPHADTHEWGETEVLVPSREEETGRDWVALVWKTVATDPLASLFFALYVIVAVATFRHSAIGFASIEKGSIFWGIIAALAIDVGMIVSASYLRQRITFFPALGLFVAALASIYTQVLYAVMYAEQVEAATGAAWMGDSATWIIEKRVIILPVLLPLLAVVYAFAAKRGVEESRTDPPDVGPVIDVARIEQGPKIVRLRSAWTEHGINADPKMIAAETGTHVTYARKVRKTMLAEIPEKTG